MAGRACRRRGTRVELRYLPPGFAAGIAVALLAFVVGASLLVWYRPEGGEKDALVRDAKLESESTLTAGDSPS